MPTPLDYQLAHRFKELGRRLRESAIKESASTASERAAQCEVPLAFWALPTDRRLPKALLGRSTLEIVDTPFAKLYATPGIGIKKLATLIRLLERAAAAIRDAPGVAQIVAGTSARSASVNPASVGGAAMAGTAMGGTGGSRVVGPPAAADFDPATVSELQWFDWRAAVKRHGLTSEPLGRFALTLRDLPGVLWSTPLSHYADLTLEQVRHRKTHGEKRVRAVIQVFAVAHSLLGDEPPAHLTVRVLPAFAVPIERWLLEASQGPFPAAAEVRRGFTEPLVKQLQHDADVTVADLVADRLRDTPAEFKVRAAAKELGLTRARVYQLLARAAAVMSVRWPAGSSLVQGLRDKIHRSSSRSRNVRLFLSTAALFFPRRGSSGDLARQESHAARQTGGAQPEDADEDAAATAA